MKQPARLFAFLVFGVAVALGVAGCGGGGSSPNPNTTISVVIFPGSASIPVNGVINFTAVVYNFTANGAVTWSARAGSFAGSVFTAPGTTGNVTVTATSQEDKTKSATVTVMVGAAQPVTVSPAAVSLSALGTQTFTASGNGPFNWTVTASSGADPGTIDQSGNYTAPRTPPPGGTVTISALSAAGSGTATVTVLFSAATLSGQYTFSYAGEDAGGFLAVAGTFTANGAGLITGGVEDVNSAATGIVENPISGGSLAVGPDGRTIATVTTGLGTVTWQVTLISEQHALLVRFDTSATGSGTIDQANPADFSVSAIANNYSFGISGIDSKGTPMAIAGRFLSDGAGTFPLNSAIQDVNDGGTVTQADLSLHGNILSLDSGTGRGTLELISTVPGTGTLTFAFYIIDNTHFKLMEIDNGSSGSCRRRVQCAELDYARESEWELRIHGRRGGVRRSIRRWGRVYCVGHWDDLRGRARHKRAGEHPSSSGENLFGLHVHVESHDHFESHSLDALQWQHQLHVRGVSHIEQFIRDGRGGQCSAREQRPRILAIVNQRSIGNLRTQHHGADYNR